MTTTLQERILTRFAGILERQPEDRIDLAEATFEAATEFALWMESHGCNYDDAKAVALHVIVEHVAAALRPTGDGSVSQVWHDEP